MAACGSKGQLAALPPDDTDDEDCTVDTSLAFDSAYALNPGTEAGDTLCPRRDQDFWSISMGEGELAQVDILYEKLTTMQLAVDWYGPAGACVPTSLQTCSDSATCPTGQTCDAGRGGCRRIALGESCVQDSHCQSGERCAGAQQKLATVLEASGSASQHRVVTTFASRMAGTYYLVVRDNLNTTSDSTVRYQATITVVADPDAANEINDTKNLATPIASGVTTSGYLSQTSSVELNTSAAGDIDWFVITPTLSTQPVAVVDLSWSEGSAIEPTFTLYQGNFAYESAKIRAEGSGTSATNRRHAAFVLPSATEPIYVRVSDTSGSYDITRPYSLTVTLSEDSNEATTRNDTPDAAIVLSLSSPPASATPNAATIVAENDQDWYRIDRGTSAENSLIRITVNAGATSDYLLQLTTFVPETQSCTADADCTAGGRCLAAHTCIAPWVQRPSPDGPGDPQLGGLSPNYIETQLPMFESGIGAMYLLVTHIAATPLDIPGYGASAYQLTVEHEAEPDDIDRSASPDNIFLTRPLAPNLYRDDFLATARSLTTASSGGGDGAAFVALAPGSISVVNVCTPLALLAFDAAGAAVDPGATTVVTVTIGADNGSLFSTNDCVTTALPSPLTIIGPSATVYHLAPSTALYSGTLTTNVSTDARQMLSTMADSGVTAMTFTTTADGPMPRRLALGSATTLRLQLAATATGVVPIYLSPTNASVACGNPVGTQCPGATSLGSGFTPACGATPSTIGCYIAITSGQSYDIRVEPSAAGVVALRALTTTYGGTTFVASAESPRTITVATTTGYLSYEGDQDFFTMPLTGLIGGGITLTTSMPASPLDVRISATRGDWGVSVGEDYGADDCSTAACSLQGATCTTRKTCDQPAYGRDLGPAATTEEARCIYVDASADTLEVWVNDISANDADEVHPYEFSLKFTEGCPAVCDGVYDCTQ